ncbi:MAG: DUF5615 family PIN-like protein [Acidobacteria bacterium]|nr:DUF5615 family PIN-like protein [Acidobacteriota bacterium]
MRVLLDECVDARFAREIVGHDVTTVPRMGWAGVTDRVLLERAKVEFDVLLTIDRNLEFQQNLTRFDTAVVILSGRSSRLADLKPLAAELLGVISSAALGKATRVTP